MLHQATLQFNGGEITPYLAYLTPLDKHASSCARLENFIPMPFGGIRKRPGTYHLATLPATARLEAFTLSDGSSFILAFTTTAVHIFQPDGTPYDLLDYSFGDPFQIQFSQVNDVIFLASPNFLPLSLSFPVSGWELADANFKYPPLLDENPIATHLLTVPGSPGGTLAPAAVFTLTSSANLFAAGHVQATFEISRKRAANDFERSLNATDGATSAPIEISGIAYFSTSSTSGGYTGSFIVEKSTNGSTWTEERIFAAEGDRNIPVTEIDVGEGYFFLRLRYTGTSHAPSRGILAAASPFIRGLARITAFTNATTVTASAITRVPIGETQYWAEGAFSAHRGFPRAITLHDRRRIYGGTLHRPMSIWASAIDDLNNFRTGTADDEGFYRTLAATRQSPIVWMASQRRLYAGTEEGEWVINPDQDGPLTPESFTAREYTRFGSSTVPALVINDSVFFIERQGFRLRELAYVLERESYDAANLTRLAEHISASGITQISYQHSREPLLWSVTAAGDLLAFAYDRRENLAAWSRHTTITGKFRSVAVLRRNANDDAVFVLIERTHPDTLAVTHHLEKLATSQQFHQEQADLTQIHHVDSGIYSIDPATLEIPVPAHLEGQTLHTLADGIFYESYVLDSKITLPIAASHIHTGLPITSTLASLPQDITLDAGTTHARTKRAHELKLAIYNTFGGSYTYDAQTNQINYTTTGDLTDTAPALLTGWMEHTLPPAHLQDLTFSIVHTEPYPFICRAAVLSWQLHEP